MTIDIKPRSTAVFLGVVLGLVFLADLLTLFSTYVLGHDYVFGLLPLFSMDGEHNVPTFFTSTMQIMGACLALLIGLSEKNRGGREHGYWLGLAAILTFIALDEYIELHEILNRLIRGTGTEDKPFYVSWVIPYSAIAFVVGLPYLRFLARLRSGIRSFLVLAAILYLGGSVGIELLGGWYRQAHGWHAGLGFDLFIACEETLEMSSMIVLIYALILYAGQDLGSLSIRIPPAARSRGVERTDPEEPNPHETPR